MIAVYVVVAMALAGAVALMLIYHSKRMKMISSTAGRVVRAEEREIRDETSRREETRVVCRYVVAGREYSIERTYPGRQAVRFGDGREIPIRYNPANPAMARIAVD